MSVRSSKCMIKSLLPHLTPNGAHVELCIIPWYSLGEGDGF